MIIIIRVVDSLGIPKVMLFSESKSYQIVSMVPLWYVVSN